LELTMPPDWPRSKGSKRSWMALMSAMLKRASAGEL